MFRPWPAVDVLRKGYTTAREIKPVSAVDEKYVYAVLPYASPTIAALVELQLFTGMRPCELVIMQPCDISKEPLVSLKSIKTVSEAWRELFPSGQ